MKVHAALAVALAALSLAAVSPVQAQDYGAIITATDRSDVDRKTDERREPVKLLTFTGAKTGWRVLDIGAGGGYSTELMARSVGPTGKVWAQNEKANENLDTRQKKPVMANVTLALRSFNDPAPEDARNLDLITFFFAYHDTTAVEGDRAAMTKGIVAALKPGGLLGIADHAARPEDGATGGRTYHRIAEQALRGEVEAAGFKLVAEGDFLRNPQDPRDTL